MHQEPQFAAAPEGMAARLAALIGAKSFGAAIPHLRTDGHNGAYDVVLVDDLRALLASEATDPAPAFAPPTEPGEVLYETPGDAVYPAPEDDFEALTRTERGQVQEVMRDRDASPHMIPLIERFLADRRATDPPAGETVTEWGVRCPIFNAAYRAGGSEEAKDDATTHPGDVIVRRERTTYPDRVTEWQPADSEEGR